MTTTFSNKNMQIDTKLTAWLVDQFCDHDNVSVTYGQRTDATVPQGNLVEGQRYVGERLVRVSWSSPQRRGEEGTYHVTVEYMRIVELLDLITHLTKDTPEPAALHWLHHELHGDWHADYCWTCVSAVYDSLIAGRPMETNDRTEEHPDWEDCTANNTHIHGGDLGYESEECRHCEKCGAYLSVTYLTTGVRTQLQHYEKHGLTAPDDFRHFIDVLEGIKHVEESWFPGHWMSADETRRDRSLYARAICLAQEALYRQTILKEGGTMTLEEFIVQYPGRITGMSVYACVLRVSNPDHSEIYTLGETAAWVWATVKERKLQVLEVVYAGDDRNLARHMAEQAHRIQTTNSPVSETVQPDAQCLAIERS